MSFIEMCKAGKATPDQVDAFVEKWHNAPASKDTLTLREFLGMTEREYEDWGNGIKTIDEIIKARDFKKTVKREIEDRT